MAFAWSAVQSWVGKLIALSVFIVVSRYLSPSELGTAHATILLITFVAILSEQGYQDAVVQKKKIDKEDLNLPFIISMTTALLASVLLIINSDAITNILGIGNSAYLIWTAALLPPISVLAMFEIGMLRRSLEYRKLARVSLFSAAGSGVVAIVLAVNGQGALSLVVQTVSAGILGTLLLLWSPVWKPSKVFKYKEFKSLFVYSSNVFGSKLIDFFSGKMVDLIILTKFGASGVGIYAIGSKLYLTLLQLLASAIIDVALSVLSRVAADKNRLRDAYLRLMFVASCTTLPLFVGISATSQEICGYIFGDKWEGASEILAVLSAYGAVQVVQFFNGSAIAASGKASLVLLINIIKLAAGFVAITMTDAQSVVDLTVYFVISQLAVSPISFAIGMKITETSVKDLLPQLIPGVLAAMISFWVVCNARPFALEFVGASKIGALTIMLTVYFATAALFVWMLCKDRLLMQVRFLKNEREVKQ